MTTFELSFTPTFYNESLSLPKQVSRLVGQKLKVLADDPHSAHGDAKKLKGYANVYRAAVVKDEQRRLFFGGCTRAMPALLVCGSRGAPSPFLDQLTAPLWRRDGAHS